MNVSNAVWGATVIANLGLTGLAATTAQAYFDENFAAGKTQGEIGLAAAVWLQTPSLGLADATFKSFAETFTANVTSGVTYSQNAANTAPIASASTSVTTFTLTTSVDERTGGNNDDTFKASIGTGATFAATDVLNGGAGTDTLDVVDVDGGTALPGLLNISNIEALNFRSAGAATVDSTG
jgi:S-layer protein